MGILGRFAAALATTVALSASVGVGTAVSTTSDPYSTKINTGWLFEVIAGGGDHPGDDTDDGGLLPDTGGPALLWLLLGVGLVGGGIATVLYARRRTSSPATA
jgi:hypothetical protein